MKIISRGIKYGLFCAAATVSNIATQRLILTIMDLPLLLAMAVGTLAGLVLKYLLDKKYIFSYIPASCFDDFFTFILYGAMSIATTAVFFGTELLFNWLFDFDAAKYVGAVLGLLIGYTLKYILDRKYVFSGRIKIRLPKVLSGTTVRESSTDIERER